MHSPTCVSKTSTRFASMTPSGIAGWSLRFATTNRNEPFLLDIAPTR